MKTKKIICAILIFATIFMLMPVMPTAVTTTAVAAASTEDIVIKVISEPTDWYNNISHFREGLAVVQSGETGLSGYINRTGKIVIPCDYWTANSFSEGLAVVTTNEKDSKCGVIDKTGKIVIAFGKYEAIYHFSDGLAIVSKNEKFGYIDKTGKLVIPYNYDFAASFQDGLAIVSKDGKSSIIDKTGKIAGAFSKYDNMGSFSDGLAVVKKDGKYGYVDKTGKLVIPYNYDYANPFYEGMAAVYKDGKYGYIDKTGKIVIQNPYGGSNPFLNGLTVVFKGGKYGAIDKTGKLIIPFEYDRLDDFYYGAAVAVKGSKSYVIDTKGRIKFTCDYLIGQFYEGIAVTMQKDTETTAWLWGLIELIKVGYPIGDVLYSDITAYINGHAIPTSIIKGKTLVVAEDLRKYGFDVKWDGVERTLKVEINKSKPFSPLPVTKDTKNKPGTFKCKYLYTDIKTYLSGEVVESYAIDGVTLIDFELLKRYGRLIWDGKTREIRLVIN